MRPIYPWVSGAIFAAAAALTLAALWVREGSEQELWLVYEVLPGHSLGFHATAAMEDLKVISAVRPQAWEWRNPVQFHDYRYLAAWVDDDGDAVHEVEVHERSRLLRLASAEGLQPGTTLLRDPAGLCEPRTTQFPTRPYLPEGGQLRLSVPEDGEPLVFRVWGQVPIGPLEAERRARSATQRSQQGYQGRLGMPDWRMVSLAERRLLTPTTWVSLRPAEDTSPRWLAPGSRSLTVEAQQTSGRILEPGRSLAINLVAPAQVVISGPDPLDALSLRQIGLSAEDTPISLPDLPLGVGDRHATRVVLDGIGPSSLVVHNPTDSPLGPLWFRLDPPQLDALWGYTAAATLGEVRVDEVGDALLIAPEWRYPASWEVGPSRALRLDMSSLAPGAPVRLAVRPVLDGPEDRDPRELRVGRRGQIEAAQIAAEPSPFEVLLPARGWLGEPQEVFLIRGDEEEVSLTGDRPLLVTPSLLGLPLEETDGYQLPPGARAAVRYRHVPPTRWRPLLPDQAEGDPRRFAAAVRLELPEGGAPSYRTLAPDRRADQARTWLRPLGEEEPWGLLSCALHGGETTPLLRGEDAIEALDGRLSATLHLPLGASWRLSLDGLPWREGEARQAVVRTGGAVGSTSARARFEAPAEARAYLLLAGTPAQCARPARPLRAWPLDPGESIQFTVEAPGSLAISGFSRGPAALEVRVDGGAPNRAQGLVRGFTLDQQQLILPLEEGAQAACLDLPGASLGVLESRAVRLYDDLAPGPHRVTVTNQGEDPVQVFGMVPGPRRERWGIEELQRWTAGGEL